ncbi:sigma-70 family RNA polymerase sigma factor [bacterium]|nr:sigma-70 family RNA polymerase sigma factor [bacterium]
MSRTNEDWLADLRSADEQVQSQVVRELRDRLERIVSKQFRRRSLSDGCIEDLVQEAALRIFTHLETFRGESQFMTWSTAITVRTGLEMIRRGFWAKGETSNFFIDSDHLQLTGSFGTAERPPEVHAQQREVLQILETAMRERLTKRQSSALVRELQGWTATKIAAELETTRGAVYKLTHDARQKLKSELEAAGLDGDTINDVFFP